MKTIQFFIPGKPVGKERPRTGGRGIIYTPKKTVQYERYVRDRYHLEAGTYRYPEGTAVRLTVKAVYPIPESWTKAKKQAAKEGKLIPGKPDGDNILKIIADALNGEAYDDDRNIYRMEIEKAYGTYPEETGVTVILRERPEE